ncbi:MAG: LysM peptidoglycan-binding domain-containing protein [Lachnospiraceae bacterium]|nr:LysM peptidoglycan-binding domain-containing protein [Lachnospiraceae bacterium]
MDRMINLFRKDSKGRYIIFRNYYFIAAVIILGAVISLGIFHYTAKVSSASTDQKQKLISVKVQDGDTLWEIAADHYTSQFGSVKKYVTVIKETNSLKNDTLIPDSYIAVPVYEN